MKRLTERNDAGDAMAICCGNHCKNGFACMKSGFQECSDIDEIISRLADIEDILGDNYNLINLKNKSFKKNNWIKHTYHGWEMEIKYECPKCHIEQDFKTNYCQNCGALMEK